MECSVFVSELSFCFKYGLSWPNHYAYEVRAAILNRMAVSKAPKLDSEAKISILEAQKLSGAIR